MNRNWTTHRATLLFLLLLCVAAAWASPPDEPAEITPDEAFANLETYDYGQSRRGLAFLELYIPSACDSPDATAGVIERLAAVVADDRVSTASRDFACDQLALVGDDRVLPTLERMLSEPATAETSRRTLAAIPGEASTEVLRKALNFTEDEVRVGVVNVLGDRRDAEAIAPLGTLINADSLDGAEFRSALANAAVGALGKIGTPEAAAALDEAAAKSDLFAPDVLHAARLRCAGLLAAEGNADRACEILRPMAAADHASHVRIAALGALSRVAPEIALPLLAEALGGDDDQVSAAAIECLAKMEVDGATEALCGAFSDLPKTGQVLVLGALERRGDASALPVVRQAMASEDDAVLVAAIAAFGRLAGVASFDALLPLAASEHEAVAAAARRALARMTGPGVDDALVSASATGDPVRRAEAMRLLVARRSPSATPVLRDALSVENSSVRMAAWEGLGVLAAETDYEFLVTRLLEAGEDEAAEARKAVGAVALRLDSEEEQVGPLLAAMHTAETDGKVSILQVLAQCGGARALECVAPAARDENEEVADAAVRALAGWPGLDAAEPLLDLVRSTSDPTHRTLALRGYIRLAAMAQDERVGMVDTALGLATEPDEKRLVLGALSGLRDARALELAASLLDDDEVRNEAVLAVLRTAAPIARSERELVATTVSKALEVAEDEDTVEQLRAVLKRAATPVDVLAPAPYGPDEIETRRQTIQDSLPADARLVAYLDCGVEGETDKASKPGISLANGLPHCWGGSADAAPAPLGTVAYEQGPISVNIEGLKENARYAVGLAMWDYDGNGRRQSVRLTNRATGESRILMPATDLPALARAGDGPLVKVFVLTPEDTQAGELLLTVQSEAAPNTVLSEVWLVESDKPMPDNMEDVFRAGKSAAHVLIVTGQDYPGHKWPETTPVLRDALAQDPRLTVRVVEDPYFLDSEALDAYDAVVLHFMNWEAPSPGPAARENLRRFVDGGKGLVIVHFACGAFPDWPEFANLAGKVYDPKLRGHDPYGAFTVEIIDHEHPVTRGLEDFETIDELYTCVVGQRPVDLLATARSKVDGKDYPMAFAFDYGKGRVFHSPLGHDAQAFCTPGVAALFRRATAWVAGLEPAE